MLDNIKFPIEDEEKLRVSFEIIPLLVRVCCKLYNLCITNFGVGASIAMARGDAKAGDLVSPLFTDGTGRFRGQRTDLNKRYEIESC